MVNSFSDKLYIKKRSFFSWLVLFIIAFPFFYGLFIEFLGVADIITFLPDLSLVIIAFFAFATKRVIIKRDLKFFVLFIIVFSGYAIINYIFNFQSALFFLFGFRNTFRLYFAFFFFATFLDNGDIKTIFKFFDIIFWVNVPVMLFQFFFLDLNQDYLGGIFGALKGCNSYVNIFFCITAIKSIVFFLNKKESIYKCILKNLIMLILAAMAELKFFFIEFLAIALIAVLITSFSWRKLIIIVSAMLGAVFGVVILSQIFPSTIGMFAVEKLLSSASDLSGYTGQGDVNRLTAIPIISKNILKEPLLKLFGLGLGNCEKSNFAFFNTPFYNLHSYLNYNWFTHAILYLELGFFGLIIFILFYVLVIINAHKKAKRGATQKEYSQMAIIAAAICLLLLIYNSSLRLDEAYMLYFILALPFIKGFKNEAASQL